MGECNKEAETAYGGGILFWIRSFRGNDALRERGRAGEESERKRIAQGNWEAEIAAVAVGSLAMTGGGMKKRGAQGNWEVEIAAAPAPILKLAG